MDSSLDSPSQWSPAYARQQVRTNPSMQKFHDSGGFCLGYVQTNVSIVPSAVANDVFEFCRVNEAPCPLLYRSKPGEISAGYLAKTSDIRKDLSQYAVYKKSPDGTQQHSTTHELTDYPWNDMVTFYTGCSFSFEDVLGKEGIYTPDVFRGISLFETNIECVPIGQITCPGGMVVSLRPIKKDLVQKAVEITARFDAVHGAPIHIGDPAMIGIRNILSPEWGNPTDLSDRNLVPVFWGCGHTLVEVVRRLNLDIAFGHTAPGTLFLTDVTIEDFFRDKVPEHGNEHPIVVPLQDEPYFASILGEQTHARITKLEEFIDQASQPNKPKQLVNAALRVSHAKTVAIVTGFEPANEIDELLSMLSMVKILQAVGKVVTIVTSDVNVTMLEDVFTDLIKAGMLQKEVDIEGISTSSAQSQGWGTEEWNIAGLLQSAKRFNVVIELRKAKLKITVAKETILPEAVPATMAATVNDGQNGTVNPSLGDGDGNGCKMSCVDVRVVHAGWALNISVFMLHNCLIHSRYRRYGIGKHRNVTLDVVMNTVKQLDSMCEFLKSRDNQISHKKLITKTYKQSIEQMVSIITNTN